MTHNKEEVKKYMYCFEVLYSLDVLHGGPGMNYFFYSKILPFLVIKSLGLDPQYPKLLGSGSALKTSAGQAQYWKIERQHMGSREKE